MSFRSLLLWSGSVLLVASASGATVLSTTGTPVNCLSVGGDNGVAANGVLLKRQWTQTRGYTNVTISAALETFDSTLTQVTAYLTTQAGPGTTVANQIATATVTVPVVVAHTATLTTLFSGLALGPGTYYVTITGDPNAPPTHPQCWSYTTPPTIVTDTGVSGISDSQAAGSLPAYPPASLFGAIFGTIGIGAVTGDAIASPTLSKSFGAATIGPANPVSLTFVLANPNSATTLNALAFTDVLPAGLIVAAPSGLSGNCSGTITATAGGNTVSLTGASLAAGASCTFKVNVASNGLAVNALTNTTSTVTSTETAPGAAASASLFVGDPYQLRYASNLASGDSVVNIINTGASATGTISATGTTAANGNLCYNVYAFSPDEQLISCCSCFATPNSLVSLSARNDLISNTLTPGIPTSIVIKLVATPATSASSCNAATVTGAGLAAGMVASGTTIHLFPAAGGLPTAGTYAVTETAFTSATLSSSELARLASLCGFIQSNGSGFGICKSCRFGGLGAVAQ